MNRPYSPGRCWPRERAYPLVGAVLSIGAALGYLAVRCVLLGTWPTLRFVEAELATRDEAYAYIVVSAMLTLTVLGALLGRSEDRLRASATHDALTGLYNRAFMHAELREELARTQRYGTPLTLMIIDVDGLKQINDRGGHEAGDAALGAVAESLRRACRASDVAARFGGDEFVLLAPETTAEQAMDLAARLREVLSRTVVDIAGRAAVVSVSVGIVDVDAASDLRPEAMYAAADRALYEAKAAGRDRAKISSRPPPPVALDATE